MGGGVWPPSIDLWGSFWPKWKQYKNDKKSGSKNPQIGRGVPPYLFEKSHKKTEIISAVEFDYTDITVRESEIITKLTADLKELDDTSFCNSFCGHLAAIWLSSFNQLIRQLAAALYASQGVDLCRSMQAV